MSNPDWNGLAETGPLTPAQVEQEAKQADMEDSGIEVIRAFSRLRAQVRRLIDREDKPW